MYRKKQNKEDGKAGNDILFDFFRDNLENVELPVSDKCWDNISGRIAKETVTARRTLSGRLSAVAAVLLIALLSGVFYYISSDSNDASWVPQLVGTDNNGQKQQQDALPIVQERKNNPSSLEHTETLVTEKTKKADHQPTHFRSQPMTQNTVAAGVASVLLQEEIQNVSAPSVPDSSLDDNTTRVVKVIDTEHPLVGQIIDKNIQDSINSVKEKKLQDLLDLYNNTQQDDLLVAQLSDDKHSGKWGLSASFGSATSSSKAIHQTMPTTTMLSIDQVFLSSKTKNSVTDIEYAPPFSVGLTVSKELNKTFALETGLVYTRLSTTYKDLDNKSYSTSVKLHYLGIPVNVLVNIWDINSRFRVYAGAGAMIEKGLRLNFSQENIAEKQTVTEKRSVSGVQWSLNGSVGASYTFYDNWNIYVEPQISYYFDNNQPISIRTEKDAIFSLNSGIRYQF